MDNSRLTKDINISIVTVAMNRTEHLLHSTRAASSLLHHSEHIILDYGSEVPIDRDCLPMDTRIKLVRSNNKEGVWWLTHSYNLAFSLARGDYILKLDADVILKNSFLEALIKRIHETKADLLCNRLTLQDWSLSDNLFTTNGLFCFKRESLERVNGFNPYIQGWGWDEIDLYSRFFLSGLSISRLPSSGVEVINHGDHLRDRKNNHVGLNIQRVNSKTGLGVPAARRIKAQNFKNREIAISFVNKDVCWPPLRIYNQQFIQTGSLIDLPPVKLFEKAQRYRLVEQLREILLEPSRLQNKIWRILRRFKIGPYSTKNTRTLLENCNIDLSLVFYE